jgi:hypothetical protein
MGISNQEKIRNFDRNQFTDKTNWSNFVATKDKSIFYLFCSLACLFPITTFFQGLLSYINDVLVGVLFVILFLNYLINGLKKEEIVWVSLAIFFFFFPFFMTNEGLVYLNIIFYFPVLIIFLSFIACRFDSFSQFIREKNSFIKDIIVLWVFLMVISMFLPSSWENGTFVSLNSAIWRYGAEALMIESLIICVLFVQHDRLIYCLSFPTVVFFFLGTSRTYFLIGLIGFLLCQYSYFKSINKVISICVPLTIIGLFVFFGTSIYDKFVTSLTSDYYSGINQFSSSRSIFWKADIDAFYSLPISSKLFGAGYNFVYLVNFETVGRYIWAHNDFIEILCTYGYFGLFVYFLVFFRIFNIPKRKGFALYIILILVIFVFNASFNMLFTYFCSMLSIPFFIFPFFLAKNNDD